MNIKKVFRIAALSLCIAALSAATTTTKAQPSWPPVGMLGSGTLSDPWMISTDLHLGTLSAWLTYGNTSQTVGKYYKLANNITMTTYASSGDWTPIGSANAVSAQFCGHFDGDGKIISGLYVSRTGSQSDYSGLFGATIGATIVNLRLENCTINVTNNSANYVGALVASAESTTIQNCYVSGNISASVSTVGGLVGYAYSGTTIQNCYSACNITTSSPAASNVGGLVATNSGTIENCYASGKIRNAVLTSSSLYLGGLLGYNNSTGTVRNCVALNDSVFSSYTASSGNINRVMGYSHSSATATNNYADSSMVLRNGSSNVSITNGSAAAGTARNRTTLQTLYFYTNTAHWTSGGAWNANDPSGVWKICYGETLPRLRMENTSCSFIPVTNITGIPTTAIEGIPLTLTGTVQPSTATNKSIDWKVSNDGGTGASISGVNTFSAASAGVAVVNLSIANGQAIGMDYQQTVYITIDVGFVSVDSISNLPTTATAEIPLTLTATVYPSNADNQSITWSISTADNGSTGASILGNVFTAASKGTATVTATITNGTAVGTDYMQNFNINVNAGFVAVTAITNPPTTAMEGVPLTLTATVEPDSATFQSIIWSVSAADDGTTGASISPSNVFTALYEGTATVTATITNGTAMGVNHSEDFHILVIEDTTPFVPVASIVNVPDNVMEGVPLVLTATVLPPDASRQDIIWEISPADNGSTGAVISGTNTLLTTSSGTATLTATIINGTDKGIDFTDDFIITVTADTTPVFVPVTNIAGIPATGTAKLNLRLNGVVQPATASFKEIVWQITNAGTTGATLIGSLNNVIETTDTGTITLLATIIDGTDMGTNYTQPFNIRFLGFVAVTNITGVPNTATANTTLYLEANISPTNASDKSITWSVVSDGGTEAEVWSNNFRAYRAGEATIKATIANGKAIDTAYSKEFTITVNPGVGINDVGAGLAPALRIYPNPTTGKLKIENGQLKMENEELTIEIVDIVGSTVLSRQFSTFNFQFSIELDLSHLAAGLYFLKVDNRVIKVIKE